MANPAHLLARQLREWRVPARETAAGVRNLGGEGYAKSWRVVRQASNYLDQLEIILAGMEATGRKVSQYRDAIPKWTAAVFYFNQRYAWKATVDNSGFEIASKGDLALLDALDDAIEGAGIVAEFSEDDRNDLTTLLDDVVELVKDSDDLPIELRRYLFEIVSLARHAVDEYEISGDFSLQSAVERLVVAFNLAVQRAESPESEKKWRDKWQRAVSFLVKTAFAALIQLGVGYGLENMLPGLTEK